MSLSATHLHASCWCIIVHLAHVQGPAYKSNPDVVEFKVLYMHSQNRTCALLLFS